MKHIHLFFVVLAKVIVNMALFSVAFFVIGLLNPNKGFEFLPGLLASLGFAIGAAFSSRLEEIYDRPHPPPQEN